MPRPETTPEQKAEVRQDIRRAASALYNREGQAGFSVRAIAKEAGVSVGTIYTYFGNIQGLLESLWNEPVDRFSKQLEQVAERTADPVARIRALMDVYLQFATDYPELYRNVFLYVRPLEKPSPIRTPAEDAVLPALLTQAIIDGQGQGRIRDGDASDYSMMLWGGLHGCLALPNNFGRLIFSNPDEVAESVIDLLLDALTV